MFYLAHIDFDMWFYIRPAFCRKRVAYSPFQASLRWNTRISVFAKSGASGDPIAAPSICLVATPRSVTRSSAHQHLTLNLSPLKQNLLFDSSSAPRLEFYFILFSLINHMH